MTFASCTVPVGRLGAGLEVPSFVNKVVGMESISFRQRIPIIHKVRTRLGVDFTT